MIANIPESAAEDVIAVDGLSRRFGTKVALDQVSLKVPRGVVFGLIGANGAGKTTLIKHLLGLLRAEEGTVRLFDRDPVKSPVEVLSRIGYLSEDTDLPGWMRVSDLMRYTAAFFPSWDWAYADELRKAFELNPHSKIKQLSRGQRSRAGLVAALSYRPELLILDEPSSGLDPIVRQDILGAVIRTVADAGRTVLFSSHLLEEVERVSDYIALISQGRIVYAGPLDDLKASHHLLTVRFNPEQSRPPFFDGALNWQRRGQEWTAVCRGRIGELVSAAEHSGGQIVDRGIPSLDEIFVAHSKPTETAIAKG